MPWTAAVTAAEREIGGVMKRWNQFKKETLPEINRKLHEANLPEIQVESSLQVEEPMVDED